MRKKIIISLILVVLSAFGFFIIFNNQEPEKERVERMIKMSDVYKVAKSNFESSHFIDAFITYNKILNEHPEQDWLRLEIGDMYAKTKEYNKALDYYFNIQSPKELNIGNRQLDLRIGGIYEKIEKTDSAIFYYNKIIQAESEVNKYIEYDVDRVSAFNRLGEIAFNKANYNEAIHYLSQAIEIKRLPKDLYIRANAYYLIERPDLAIKDYNECIDMIRKIYINKNPYFKDVLCDTCGTYFGEKEYMAVLQEWRNFDEKIKEKKQLDSFITSRLEYTLVVDSIPKWHKEIELLKDKNNLKSVERINALKDSVKKYTDTTMKFNIYD